MEFCDKCGSMMRNKEEKNKVILVCPGCGHKLRNYKHVEVSEKVEKKPMDDVVIIDKKEEGMPKTKVACPKCGHTEASWWLQQTRSVDEAPTLFLRCVACGYSWREYG